MNNVLESDLEVLKLTDQPKLVDAQLHQLYTDLELEGLSTKLKLEEGVTSSSCSSGEELQGTSLQKVRNSCNHFKTLNVLSVHSLRQLCQKMKFN